MRSVYSKRRRRKEEEEEGVNGGMRERGDAIKELSSTIIKLLSPRERGEETTVVRKLDVDLTSIFILRLYY